MFYTVSSQESCLFLPQNLSNRFRAFSNTSEASDRPGAVAVVGDGASRILYGPAAAAVAMALCDRDTGGAGFDSV